MPLAVARNPLRDPRDRRLPRIAGPCGLVIFGVTGDLSRKKLMPAVYDLANRGLLPPGFALVGLRPARLGRPGLRADRARLGQGARPDAVPRGGLEAARARASASSPGDFADDEAFDRLHETILELDDEPAAPAATTRSTCRCRRSSSPTSCASSRSTSLADGPEGAWRRVVIEKPFGHDLASARELNNIVGEVFDSGSVFRIDHYLGKETVQNILALRFANSLFEPIWNANYVDHVQITMAEDVGIGGRAGYYDGIGAARDVIQNHLLQLLALTAMEEPVSFDAAEPAGTRRRRSSRPSASRRTSPRTPHAASTPPGWQGGVQVGGYLEEDGISPTSTTETYAAMRLDIDTRRWAGVPFYLRTGKRLGRRVTEIAVVFKRAPHLPFEATATEELGQNALVIRVQPDEGISVRFGSKVPGTAMEVRDVTMDFAYGESFLESSPEAYERLILDVLIGEAPLFPRHEEVELSWKILDPVEEFWATPAAARRSTPRGPGARPAPTAMMAADGRVWRRP